MNKSRLEAFSDGVLAIIITIMVLEIKVPHTANWQELQHLLPVFASYFMSFVFVGIYWANHHHLLHSLKQVSSGVIWANLNLLFWLSLVPFATGWMGENEFASNTISFYGLLLLISGISFTVLQKVVEKNTHDLDELKKAFKNLNKKGIASSTGYLLSVPLAYVNPLFSGIIFIVIAVIWLVPDKNIEEALKNRGL